MEPTIQEAQQALKLLMKNKEQIMELCSQMEIVCSEYNENPATISERQKNDGINRKCGDLRDVLEPFYKARYLIHEFISWVPIHRFADFNNKELYKQFLIDFQKLFIDLDGKFFDHSDYAVYVYKLNEFFEITPNHFYKIDGRGNPDIYSFEKDASKIEASKQEAQKRFDDDLKKRRETEQAKVVSIQPEALPGQSQYLLITEIEKVIKETILPIWKKEVLENTTDDAFLNAITTANFSTYYTKGKKQKVGYFIYSLKQIMGDAWASTVISKLNDTNASLPNFQKRTIKNLKVAMNGIVVVNAAGAQFKVDTKTRYIDKGTNQSYYKATER